MAPDGSIDIHQFSSLTRRTLVLLRDNQVPSPDAYATEFVAQQGVNEGLKLYAEFGALLRSSFYTGKCCRSRSQHLHDELAYAMGIHEKPRTPEEIDVPTLQGVL